MEILQTLQKPSWTYYSSRNTTLALNIRALTTFPVHRTDVFLRKSTKKEKEIHSYPNNIKKFQNSNQPFYSSLPFSQKYP
jgi:hypothetical protein